MNINTFSYYNVIETCLNKIINDNILVYLTKKSVTMMKIHAITYILKCYDMKRTYEHCILCNKIITILPIQSF